MILPPNLKAYFNEASALLKKGGIGAIEFSGGTYQIEVFDSNLRESLWTFLQFDHKNRLTDSFCSCEDGGELSSCVHLAAAYLRIFLDSEIPLHSRFQKSFWNTLCTLFADRYGDDPKELKQIENQYILFFQGEKIFSITCHENMEDIFYRRRIETEENSLKFSNLSQQEIELWRQGRPGFELKYELSFWNDLAKRLMFLQEGGSKYEINFEYTVSEMPHKVIIQFEKEEMILSFSLFPEDLSVIIPSLSTVTSPLKVYDSPEDSIEFITYDKEKEELHIHPKKNFKENLLGKAQQNLFGNWVYIPRQGFYFQGEHPLLKQRVYKGHDIAEILDHHHSLLKAKLKNVKIAEASIPVCYELTFDTHWNFHINAYLFTRGDLKNDHTKVFGSWAFLERMGFVHLEGLLFDEVEKVIPQNKVEEFVQSFRLWLNLQEGFQTHITGIETKLNFEVLDNNSLLFTREALMEDAPFESKDFGSWIYIKQLGFFSKAASQTGSSIKNDTLIPSIRVPLFIRVHHDELSLISRFFSERSPLDKMGLRVEFIPPHTITITPEFIISSGYSQKNVRFFEDYTYVEGEGFYKIPEALLIPERFRHPVRLDKWAFPRFFSVELESIKKYLLWIDPRLVPQNNLTLRAQKLTLEGSGYGLDLHFTTDTKSVELRAIWEAISHKERYLLSELGRLDLEEDRYNWIRKIGKDQFDQNQNKLILSPLELLRLNAFDPLNVIEGKEILLELSEFKIPLKADYSSLKSSLRSYQEAGVQWMWFLYHHKLSGLLCDDMGLGKTHQAMALMAAIKKVKGGSSHFLVVCPTSVIYHWEEKLKRFLPDFRICIFHGSKRDFENFREEYDILLTSYGIWRNQNELLKEVVFEAAILDEIHAAKNQSTRIHNSLLNIKSQMRIGMTGTPIENRLRELKALFDIILPNYMPGDTDYRKLFVVPIEKENNPEKKAFLKRFIKPFVLRRKKEDVLPDLPEKIEEIAHCSLSADQKNLYKEVLTRAKKGIYEELQNERAPIPYIHIFSVLSSLKQICNHPAVYLKTPQDYKKYESGKWDLFVELLNEALDSEQKVVIFSQYLSMLDIFEQYLKEISIGYASIRGSTIKRGEEIYRFNNNPDCRVFVGSLHAAGLGIDLTAGSVVIHYDRWWNAARENQATDRVHRIGQTRGVQVFKLVTKDTFEEKIDAMIVRKSHLLADVVHVDDYRFIKQFSREEILQLFT